MGTLLPEHGYRKACAGIALPSAGSVRLHEAMGFLPVGVYDKVGFTFVSWHDVGWWQLQLVPVGTASHPLSRFLAVLVPQLFQDRPPRPVAGWRASTT